MTFCILFQAIKRAQGTKLECPQNTPDSDEQRMQSYSLNISGREESAHTGEQETIFLGEQMEDNSDNTLSESTSMEKNVDRTCNTASLTYSYESGKTDEGALSASNSEKGCDYENDDLDTSGERDTDNLLAGVKPLKVNKQQSDQGDIIYFEKTHNKMRKLFVHGSFYVIGLCILIGGGVSSRFHPHVDPEEYSNCSSFDNSSFTSGDMSNSLYL